MLAVLQLLREAFLATLAILSLAPAGNVSAPDAARFAVCMVDAAQEHGVEWQQIAAIVHHESRWEADAKGATNDWGLGQIHCPSKYCQRVPTAEEQAALLDGCTNLGYVADLLHSKRRLCNAKGGGCYAGRYIRFYNPGNPTYLSSIQRIERRIQRVGL